MAEYNFEERMAAQYDRSLARTVQAIRDLADQVERTGRPNKEPRLGADFPYMQAAARVQKAITQMQVHFDMDLLFDRAMDVEEARRMAREETGGR